MRIRTPFAAAFGVFSLGSAYLGLFASSNVTPVNDKALHFIAFFVLTLTGYWMVDVHRRLLLKIVPLTAFAVDVGSEFAQTLVVPERQFDLADIGANVLGSFSAIALSAWYHRRMLERKRRRKMQGYGLVTGDDVADIELGEGSGEQESGVIDPEEGDGGDTWDELSGGLTPEPSEEVAHTNGKDDAK